MDPRARLERAAQGLLFISESESPLHWVDAPWQPSVAAAFGEQGPSREETVEWFFRGHTDEADPHDPQAQQQVPKFRALVAAITESLEQPKVHCFGETEQRCYVVGRAGGRLGGLMVRRWES